ncbi:ankyrin repeat domain-containing protein 7-like [Haliotis rubra]|uniref:ankyrin repeat domain-containing protein 7-like n=1 Tax=Haliotis rubra TaxID=36100 RepID=UPI001EE5EAD4|nr:ankyrin repeat domain-containing protein 7-like [Haliotis rubra]
MIFIADSLETLVNHLCERDGIDKEELEAVRCSFAERQQGAETEEMKAITLLIQKGLDVNKADKHGQTALHLLCQRSRVDVRTVNLLIQNGADVNLADRAENTPVHYICQRKEADVSTLYLLTERKVDDTLQDRYGRTALHHLCDRQNVRLANVT